MVSSTLRRRDSTLVMAECSDLTSSYCLDCTVVRVNVEERRRSRGSETKSDECLGGQIVAKVHLIPICKNQTVVLTVFSLLELFELSLRV